MLKKTLSVLFIFLICISLISSQANSTNENNYLKQEWTKVLEKSEFGKMILGISSLLTALGPIFKLLVGVEYSLSWYFIFVFAIWIGVVILIYNLTKNIFPNKKLICFFISVLIVGISSQAHIIELAVNFMSPLFSNTESIILGVFVGVAIFVFLTKLSKILGKMIKEDLKKEKEKRREEKSSLLEKIHDVELKGRGVK